MLDLCVFYTETEYVSLLDRELYIANCRRALLAAPNIRLTRMWADAHCDGRPAEYRR